MRLEGDVIETIRQLGGAASPQVGPQQFLGLELNPRAAVIAELVLWIGWLRWRMKNDPDATPAQRAAIAELAEELDETRKAALAEVPGLTMTEIYNLRDRQRAGQLKDLLETERAARARVGIVGRLHEQIDAEVAAAYGWADDWKNGNLPPAEIVSRLVALNGTRAAEEKAGTVRWLRPDYQIPRFGAGKT